MMEKTGRKIQMEGIIVITIGIFFTVLALFVPKNPVVLEGWLNIMVQAKLIPLAMGIMTIIFGVKFTVDMGRKKIEPTSAGIPDMKNAAIVLGVNLLYIVALIYFGFRITTAAFLILILFYLNRKKSKPHVIIGSIILFYVVSIILMPMMLSLRLP